MTQAWYATREAVRAALGEASTACDDARVDEAIESGSLAVDNLCNRTFQPVLATRYFDWPQEQTPRSWRLWLDQYDLIMATLVVSAGVEVPATDYYLEPANSGPPYSYIETRLDRPSVWSTGGTWQHALAVTGWWGYSDNQAPAGTLAAPIGDTTSTTVVVSNGATVGIGDCLTVGTERMTVTGRSLADTGQTLQAPLAAQKNDVLLQVVDGAAYFKGETLTLDAERVLVRDVAGNNLVVDRACDGTVLAAHTGSKVWTPRVLTVTRASAGTTAGTATAGTALTRWQPPALVRELVVAEAESTLMQEQAAYARTVRAQSGTGGTRSTAAVEVALDSLRERVAQALGRQVRMRAV